MTIEYDDAYFALLRERFSKNGFFQYKITDAMELYEHNEDPARAHRKLIEEYGEQDLGTCNRCRRWLCPKSLDGLCHYSYSYDSCDYCGDPEERK